MTEAPPLVHDPRWQALMARGGLVTLPLGAPDGWPHGPIPEGEKARETGADRLTPRYCTLDGHRFLRVLLLLPIRGARTVFAFDCWGSVSEESLQAFLGARAGGEAFRGSFAWLANALPGFALAEPVPCTLAPGPPGQAPRLQPHPGTALHQAQSEGLTIERLAEIHAAAGADFAALIED
jgi:hypothetical protein